MADASLVFTVEKPCPVCGQKTHVTKTKSRLMMIKADPDFCTHYKDFNPYFYVPWVCECCGYSADEKHFTQPMPSRQKEKLLEFLSSHKVGFKYSPERSLADAVSAYKLAIFFEEMLDTSLAYRASLYLKLAWVYRIAEDKENEREYMIKAAEAYDKSIMTERYPVGNLNDTTVQYVVGAIYFMIEDYEKATQYISRLISDNSLKSSDIRLYERVKNLWTDVREKRDAAQPKTPPKKKKA